MKKILSKASNLINKKQKLMMFFSFILMILVTLIETLSLGSVAGFVYLISNPDVLIDRIPQNFNFLRDLLKSKTQAEIIIYLSAILVFLFLIKNIFILSYYYFIGYLKKLINVRNTKRLLTKYLEADYTFYSEKSSKELINNLSAEIVRSSHYLFFLVQLTKEFILIFALLLTLLIISWKVTLSLFFVLCFPSIFFYITFGKISKKLGEGVTKSSENIIKNIVDSIKNFKLIRLMNIKSFFIKKIEMSVERKNRDVMHQSIISILPRYFLEILGIGLIVSLIYFFVLNDYSFEKMISILTLICLVVIRLVPAFASINTSKTQLKHFENSFKKISQQLENFGLDKKIFYDQSIIKEDFNSLKVKNLSFKYIKQSQNLLNNVDLNITKGDVLGIKGKSGVGKSTLVNIILGIIGNYKGEILINGKSFVNNLTIENFVGYVPQDTYLMDESIKRNIALGIDEEFIDNAKIDDALKKAKIFDFVKELPQGKNSSCGDDGISISGGQKQRLGIARALYRNPDLIILDEATSSLDEKTESEIFDDILSLKDKTFIIVSHKKQIIEKCNKVLMLIEDGKWKFGNKNDVLKNL